ncbi:MAG: 6-aminohexanoate hydrolase, partial [Pseudomonadota bacterium]
MRSVLPSALALSLCAALAPNPASAQAQTQGPLSADASDPRVMGWMQGFPPPPERLITPPDSVYFSFPRLRWSVCHLRRFLPTTRVSRGLGAPRPL